jgi:hypothetical protein
MLVTKKLGAPTKHPEVLVCYDFHSGIFNEEGDLMFGTEAIQFPTRIVVILTSIWSNQPITSACLNLWYVLEPF